MARRFGRAGHPVAIVSRSDTRHERYLAHLAADGTTAIALVADVLAAEQQAAVLARVVERLGPIEVLYFGPAGMAPSDFPVPIDQITGESALRALAVVPRAVDAVASVLPGMIARDSGVILLPTGLSAVRPMPPLGNLALAAAALRTYAVTLHAALAGTGVYAGSLVIGGGIRGGDIFEAMAGHRVEGLAGSGLDEHRLAAVSLDPHEIADRAWRMATARDRAELVFSVLD
ncbi:hypothetical protein BBK14_19480 [Parafrankia soli]|uniref:Short-chain dehydrogenase n=2 Tax=Parafrankia soli TaxID=2599596 RepID=A0A1S1Q2C7_9ACTN|nr:hypothetical protein BBK14_19480 [Parafrankia soli]